jgi:hypothetical protein
MMNFGENVYKNKHFLTDKKIKVSISITWYFMSTNNHS